MDAYHSYAEVFESLYGSPVFVWWNFSTVRVEFVWEDLEENKLYIILLDQNRDKLAAVVNCNLMNFYKDQNLVGGLFSLEHFQCEGTYYEYPRYEEYSFVRDEIVIKISEKTRLISLSIDVERAFPFYPSVASIKTIVEDRTTRKMLIDVVGKIVMGGRITYVRVGDKFRLGWRELFLQDRTGYIIKLRVYNNEASLNEQISRALAAKSVFYASRVKLIHLTSMNVLHSTALTKIAVNPNMLEAHLIRLMQR